MEGVAPRTRLTGLGGDRGLSGAKSAKAVPTDKARGEPHRKWRDGAVRRGRSCASWAELCGAGGAPLGLRPAAWRSLQSRRSVHRGQSPSWTEAAA